MTHPHAAPDASPSDRAFVRVFLFTVVLASTGIAAFTALVDPLGVFGTGLLPPVVTSDRDQKAALYRAQPRRPELLVLGSSRAKTLPPACLEQLTGHAAFNFAVNGAGTEDFLAILRFVRSESPSAVHWILVGVDPETLQGAGGAHRALDGSRALGPYVPGAKARHPLASLAADLLGWQAFTGALRSVAGRRSRTTPEFSLEPDGLQRYPRIEAEIRNGQFNSAERVMASIAGPLARYQNFPVLDPERVAFLRQFVAEARAAGIAVTTFIPPVHPAFVRAAEGTSWRARSEETVALLRSLEAAGAVRYVETRNVATDTLQFVDAIHFLPSGAGPVVTALTGTSGGCALQ